MKLIFSCLCLLPFAVFAQYELPQNFIDKAKEINCIIKPIVEYYIDRDFEDITTEQSNLPIECDLVLKHKEGKGFLLIQLSPTDKSDDVAVHKKSLNLFGEKISEGTPKRTIDQAYYNNTSSYDVTVSNCTNWSGMPNGKLYSLTNNQKGTFRIYWFYKELTSNEESAFSLINNSFRFRNEQSILEGRAGIGISYVWSKTNKLFHVKETIKSMDAYKKGIIPGDPIISIDGVKAYNLDYDRFRELMTGKENTKLELEVLRFRQSFTYELERKMLPSDATDDDLLKYSEIDYKSRCIAEFARKMLLTLPEEIKGASIATEKGVKYHLTQTAPGDDSTGYYYLRTEFGKMQESYRFRVCKASEADIKNTYETLVKEFVDVMKNENFSASGKMEYDPYSSSVKFTFILPQSLLGDVKLWVWERVEGQYEIWLDVGAPQLD